VNDLRASLRSEFGDPDYRYAYAESFLNTKIAMQIKVLREQRGKTQTELAISCGTKQAGFSRFEDVNHSVWKTDTLWKIARALGVRLNVSFETFGSLISEKENFTPEHLMRPRFEEDPVFVEGIERQAEIPEQEATPLDSLALAKANVTDIERYRSAKERELSTESLLRQVAPATVVSASERQFG
jgi:transcriptional regulator with XRE-family HTH domain